MDISQKGLDLVKQFEGFRSAPYKDQAGLWTIGYGCRIADPTLYPTGVTEGQAEALLMQHMAPVVYEITSAVIVQLTQNQFDALCCFVYNIGGTAFKNSTLLKILNMGSYVLAAGEFDKWDHVNGVVDPGLLRRREAEKTLFQEE